MGGLWLSARTDERQGKVVSALPGLPLRGGFAATTHATAPAG